MPRGGERTDKGIVMRVLGWSVGVTRWGDETGTYHLVLIKDGENQARHACGVLRTAGSVVQSPDPEHRCRKCLKSKHL